MHLAIVRTHPTQYFSPLYQQLAKLPGIEITVFYVLKNRGRGEFDPDFGDEDPFEVKTDDLHGSTPCAVCEKPRFYPIRVGITGVLA